MACMEAGLNRTAADAGEREQNWETTEICAEAHELSAADLQACAEGRALHCCWLLLLFPAVTAVVAAVAFHCGLLPLPLPHLLCVRARMVRTLC